MFIRGALLCCLVLWLGCGDMAAVSILRSGDPAALLALDPASEQRYPVRLREGTLTLRALRLGERPQEADDILPGESTLSLVGDPALSFLSPFPAQGGSCALFGAQLALGSSQADALTLAGEVQLSTGTWVPFTARVPEMAPFVVETGFTRPPLLGTEVRLSFDLRGLLGGIPFEALALQEEQGRIVIAPDPSDPVRNAAAETLRQNVIDAFW